MRNKNDFDTGIKDAFEILSEQQVLIESEPVEFSLEFEKKKIYNYDKKFIYVKMRAISKVAIIVICLLAAFGTITAYACYKIFKVNINKDNTDLSILEPGNISQITEIYSPSYIPSGYEQINLDIKDNSITTYFTSKEGMICLRQQIDSSEISADNEDVYSEVVYVNGLEAIYFIKHGEPVLIFYHQNYVFILDADTSVKKDELIKIAESLKV